MSEKIIRGLAIESATKTASVAVIEKIGDAEPKVLSEMTLNGKLNHSETLLPMIDSMFKLLDFESKDLDFIAVSKGPGSYTGLRIGISVAKGIARVAKAKIVGISTIYTLACNGDKDFIICPMIDARRVHAYSAVYKKENDKLINLVEADLRSVKDLIDIASEIDGKKQYLGDGSISHRSIILENADNYILASERENTPFASILALEGLRRFEEGEFSEYNEFVPDYFRVSQAKRMMSLSNGKK